MQTKGGKVNTSFEVVRGRNDYSPSKKSGTTRELPFKLQGLKGGGVDESVFSSTGKKARPAKGGKC